MSCDASNGCTWPGNDPEYQRYHDEEWGIPLTDDRALYEKIVLEGFQAGLSWITILRKRPHFRKVFKNFDAEKIACFDEKKIAALMEDPGIVRNRLKIEATISNAKAFLDLQERDGLAHFLWSFVDGKPQQNNFRSMAEVPAETEVSRKMSKALKKAGFRFVGPTTVYAMMQSAGLVNDHMVTCPRHAACRKLGRSRVI